MEAQKEVELHVTDIQAYLQCRQMWFWQSSIRMNLQPMALSAPLFLGQGMHESWDAYYKHYQKTGVFNIQVALNTLRAWCKDRADKMIESTGVLWEAEREMVNDMYALGYKMLMHYELWSKPIDKGIEVIGTEYKFRLPVPNAPGLVIAGKIDGLVRYPEEAVIWPLEFKTAASFRNTPTTFRSLQCAVYTWAARQLFDDNIKGLEYRVCLKKPPRDLVPLQREHTFSQKKDQKTSYEWAMWYLEQYAKMNALDLTDLCNAHQKLLFELQEKETFFIRRRVTRTQQQLDNAVLVLQNIGAQMADPDTPIFAQPGFHCGWCSMRDPCSLLEMGEDPSMLLSAVYNTRDYWEGDNEGRSS